MTPLQQRIMRRVWYSYAISILARKEFLKGMMLVVGLHLLATLVYVRAVVENFLATELGSLPEHVFSVLSSIVAEGKILECLSVGLVLYAIWAFPFPRFRLLHMLRPV